jgi:hypothetical protein
MHAAASQYSGYARIRMLTFYIEFKLCNYTRQVISFKILIFFLFLKSPLLFFLKSLKKIMEILDLQTTGYLFWFHLT